MPSLNRRLQSIQLRLFVGACVCLVSAGARPGAARAQEHPIDASLARIGSAPITPGSSFTIRLRAIVPPGWHLYSLTQPPGGPVPTSIEVGPAPFRLAGNIDAPVPTSAFDPNFAITSEWYQDSAVFILPISTAANATPGRHTLTTRFGYQTCTTRYCLPPREDTLHLAVTVTASATGANANPAVPAITAEANGSAPPSPASSTTATEPAATASDRVSISAEALAATAEAAAAQEPVIGSIASDGAARSARSLALFLWIAATMGALALLTPCVFPMIPITISYFSQRTEGRATALREAGLYAAGIIGSFTILGLGLSLLFGVAGINRFAASAPLNLAIAALFIVFALSLFGVLHIAVPSRILSALDGAGRSSRFGRVGTTLLMGATFSLTTFTCTAPFVGTLLVSAAGGDWRWPAAGLFIFSTAFAIPFFILALVPDALSRLPRSGSWMVTMKRALAFIELAAAMKFISNADLVQGWGIFDRQVVIAIWLVLALSLAFYLLAAGARRHAVPATAALLVVVWLTTGFAGRRMGELESFLPPAGDGSGSTYNELSWMTDDYDGALARAATEQKLVLIDFTGYTCTNCRWMEANMFPRPEVQAELEKYVRVRLFTDGYADINRTQQKLEQDKFQTVALPLYAVVDAQGNPVATFLGMTRNADEFIQFLRKAL